MLIQSTVGRLARLFEQPQLFIVAVKRILKGANQSINGLLSLSEIAICFDMQAFEGHGGEFQERFIVLLQRFAGQRLKRSDEFVAGMIDQGPLFHQLSRRDKRDAVLRGIAAAKAAGLRVKINTVALRGLNEPELPELIAWAHGEGHDITLIEVMPLGEIEDDRIDHYLPLSIVLSWFEQKAVAVLLSLLALGVKGIRLGPALPANRVAPAIDTLVDVYLRERHDGERFLDTYRRTGLAPFKEAVYADAH